MINFVQELFEEAGYKTRSYSGRGMGGKECLGVILNEGQSLGQFFGDVIGAIKDFILDEDDDNDVADAFNGMQTDSMGKGMIVYFPSVSYDEDEDEDTGDKEG